MKEIYEAETQLKELREKHGKELESWWQENLGHAFDCLTQSEARYLARSGFERFTEEERLIMQALRHIETTENDSILIKIPRAFQKRMLEIIVIPVDEKAPEDSSGSIWPKGFFAKTAGCFAATPLVREDQDT